MKTNYKGDYMGQSSYIKEIKDHLDWLVYISERGKEAANIASFAKKLLKSKDFENNILKTFEKKYLIEREKKYGIPKKKSQFSQKNDLQCLYNVNDIKHFLHVILIEYNNYKNGLVDIRSKKDHKRDLKQLSKYSKNILDRIDNPKHGPLFILVTRFNEICYSGFDKDIVYTNSTPFNLLTKLLKVLDQSCSEFVPKNKNQAINDSTVSTAFATNNIIKKIINNEDINVLSISFSSISRLYLGSANNRIVSVLINILEEKDIEPKQVSALYSAAINRNKENGAKMVQNRG
jgi:hypothetical protein